MGCGLQIYHAVVGIFVLVLVKLLSKYANIAAKRVRGAKVHGMAGKLAVVTLLVFPLHERH